MRKLTVISLVLVLVLSMIGCATKGMETDYAAAIMVDDVVYYLATEAMTEEIDQSAIIGYTQSYTDTFPQRNNETNFNRELEMPIAKVEGGIAVLYENEWYYCKQKDDDSSADLDVAYHEPFSGTITDIFFEGSGADLVEVVAMDVKDCGTIHFILSDDAACQQYFTDTEEVKTGSGDILLAEVWSEMECEKGDNSARRTAVEVTVFNQVSDWATPQLNMAT